MKEKHDNLDEPILPPEKENELQEIKKIKAKETEQLVDKKKINESQKEKEYLIKILHEIENELTEEENRNKSITNIYSKIMNPDDDEELNIRKSIKENWDNCFYRVLLHFTFCILLPLFAIVNLVGIFQILSIQKILCKAFQKGVKIFLGFEKEDENYEFYNFYGYYIKESLDEDFDFNLMNIMNCIGFLLFEYIGFYWSSIIFLGINVVSLFLAMNFFNKYREPNEKYDIMELSNLFTSNLLLFIGAGATTLFSQTILIDSFYKYGQFLRMRRKEMEDKKQKELEELQIKKKQQIKKVSENEKKEGEQKTKEEENKIHYKKINPTIKSSNNKNKSNQNKNQDNLYNRHNLLEIKKIKRIVQKVENNSNYKTKNINNTKNNKCSKIQRNKINLDSFDTDFNNKTYNTNIFNRNYHPDLNLTQSSILPKNIKKNDNNNYIKKIKKNLQ